MQYFLALLLPALVSVVAWVSQTYLSTENVSLLYIVAVILTAVNTSAKPALLSAFASFLAFNFFFTEPRLTFLVIHNADMLTIGLFLLIAVLVGHLTARLKEKLQLIEGRETFSNIELNFVEKLAVAINPRDIIAALEAALREIPRLEYCLFSVTDGQINWHKNSNFISQALRESIEDAVIRKKLSMHTWIKGKQVETAFALTDGENVIALLVTLSAAGSNNRDSVSLLTHQANLALGRTRLVQDLESEKLEKEQEVIRSSLLSSVSHDFRTPLTAMVGATSTLLELGNSLPEEQQRELLNSILSEAIRLNGYTQKLLDMTRLGRGELTLNRTTISIEEIMNVTVKRIRKQADDQKIVMEVAPHLPLLRVHAALIEQALYNVMENSLKFSPPAATIVIRSFADGDKLIVEIEDSGPGIPVAEREKVFEMFHSADRGDRRMAGTGLGLAICKGMIGAHGGSVKILDGKNGQGCRVRISLPVEREEDDA